MNTFPENIVSRKAVGPKNRTQDAESLHRPVQARHDWVHHNHLSLGVVSLQGRWVESWNLPTRRSPIQI